VGHKERQLNYDFTRVGPAELVGERCYATGHQVAIGVDSLSELLGPEVRLRKHAPAESLADGARQLVRTAARHRHSDEGDQYTSYVFGKCCREAGIMPSVGTVGDAYDNAVAEGLFATLEREVLGRRRFKSLAEAKMAIFDWHSELGRRSPVNYERLALTREATCG